MEKTGLMMRLLGSHGSYGSRGGMASDQFFQSFLVFVNEKWTMGGQRGFSDGRDVGSWEKEGPVGQSLRGW